MQRIATTTKGNARQLRREMTDAEQFLWRHLRMRQLHGLKFRRQHPCGHFILDFACVELKLAIELDGSQHAEHHEYDAKRSDFLISQGWLVLRFWNNAVFENIQGVLEKVSDASKNLLPPPQPCP